MKRFLWLASRLWIAGLLFFSSGVHAQRVGIKTNALYWAMLSPNLGAEFRLSRHVTFNLEATANPFSKGKYKTHFVNFCPEVRYWFSGRPQARHFVGIAATGSIYSLRLKETFHSGDAFGGGLTYGYAFVLGRRWSLETTVGLGLLRCRDKKYRSGEPIPDSPNNSCTLPAPIKAGVTFTYLIK